MGVSLPRVTLLFMALLAVCCAAIAGAPPTFATASTEPRVGTPSSAPFELAQRYEIGESVHQDYRRALALYCEAARAGDPRAFYSLGWMYLNGRGVARDDASAAVWLRKAAKQGSAQAVNLLALLPPVPQGQPAACPTGAGAGATASSAAPPPAIRALIDDTARNVGIDANLLRSVMSVESGFNPRAVSPKMAAGLMQLLPETASRYGVQNTFDEHQNVLGGASYLRDLLRLFQGNVTLALAAYNAGEAAVLAHGGVPPFPETISYVALVKRLCACGY